MLLSHHFCGATVAHDEDQALFRLLLLNFVLIGPHDRFHGVVGKDSISDRSVPALHGGEVVLFQQASRLHGSLRSWLSDHVGGQAGKFTVVLVCTYSLAPPPFLCCAFLVGRRKGGEGANEMEALHLG